jgi:membrane fusion protein, multidrug efflux system
MGRGDLRTFRSRRPPFGPSGRLVAVLFALAAVSCSQTAQTAPSTRSAVAPASAGRAAPQTAPVPVSAAPVQQKEMPIAIELIGTVEAMSSVAVHAQLTGELTSVNFREGDEVTKGQELFTLDRRPLEATLHQVQANLTRDVAQLENARATLQRYQGLADRGIATREQLDQSRTSVAALEATVAADKAAIESAEVQLAYATIPAPISGRVGKLLVSVGNLVRATDATPLVVINQLSPIYVAFAVPESQLPELIRYRARGPIRVEAKPPTDSAQTGTGALAFLDNAVDASTGTITARASFANADHRLLPGEFVNVRVILDRDPKAIVVPSAALQDGQQGKFVFVVAPDRTVSTRVVHVVRTVGSESVVSDGVRPGELVVTDGQTRLGPGMRVAVRGQDAGRAS